MSAIMQVLPATMDWQQNGTSAANAALTLTQASPGLGRQSAIGCLTVSWSGGAPGAGVDVQIKDGSTIIWDSYIGDAGAAQGTLHFVFPAPLTASPNAVLTVVIAAAGTGVTTKANAQGYTLPR